jgi:hypothetical protein
MSAAACSHAKQSTPPPVAEPSTPQAAASAAPRRAEPVATPSPVATPAPTPAATATPSPPVPNGSPRAQVTVPQLPPDAPPQIVSVDINETTVHSGDTVSGTVLTSSNVASVEVRVATYGMTLAKVGIGRFALAYTLGALPFFIRGTFEMKIIARNSRGDAAQQSLPITVR